MKIIAMVMMLVGVGVAEDLDKNPKIRRVPFVGVEAGSGFKELFMAEPLTKNWSIQGLMYSLTHDAAKDHSHITRRIGYFGASRAFRWRRFETALGAGTYGGSGQPFGPAIYAEAGYKSHWWKGEAVIVKNFRKASDSHVHQVNLDKYIVAFAGPQFRWGFKAEDQTFQLQLGVDQITNSNIPDPLWGGRILAPVPKIPHTKFFAKFLTGDHGFKAYFGLEFRPN